MNALELSERLKQHKNGRQNTSMLCGHPVTSVRGDGVTKFCIDCETRPAVYLEHSEVVAMLQTAVTESGLSQVAWAKAHGVSDRYVNGVLRGRVDPGPAILRALGLRKHTVFTAV
jgi:hypothetical protein